MTCCKCVEYGWADPQDPVYTDDEGNEYCLFHAPAEHKNINIDKFNGIIYQRILKYNHDEPPACDLSGTIFPGNISFNLHKLDINSFSAIFDYSIFNGFVSFSDIKFIGLSSFDSVIFNHDSSFISVDFTGRASFKSSTFNGFADFESARFSRDSSFEKSTFNDVAAFEKTFFKYYSEFDSATFNSLAIFDHTTFDASSSFLSTSFNNDSHFSFVIFGGSCIFNNTKFKHCEFNGIESNGIFIFKPDETIASSIRFSDTDLLNFEFIGSEVINVHFTRCSWPIENGRYRISAEDNEEQLEEVRDFYQRMKRKYKNEHNEAEVSQWHVSEKEVDLLLVTRDLKRAKGLHDKAIWGLMWLMLRLYRISSRFGEHMVRAGAVLAYVALAPLLILTVAKLAETGVSWTPDWAKIGMVFQDWLRCMPLTKAGLDGTPTWKLWLFWVSQLVIAIQAALFAFALRNRFRR